MFYLFLTDRKEVSMLTAEQFATLDQKVAAAKAAVADVADKTKHLQDATAAAELVHSDLKAFIVSIQ